MKKVVMTAALMAATTAQADVTMTQADLAKDERVNTNHRFMLKLAKPSDSGVGFGIAGGQFINGGRGGYFDLMYSGGATKGAEHYTDLSEHRFDDRVVSRKSDYILGHAGMTQHLYGNLYGYLAGGLYYKTEIVTLYDNTHILANDGYYSVDGDDTSFGASVAGGLAYKADTWILDLGYNTAMSSPTLAIGFKF